MQVCAVIMANVSKQSMQIPIAIITDRTVKTEALIDTGAQDSFIDYQYVRKKKLPWLQRVNMEIDFNQGTLQIDPDKVNLTLVERLCNKWFPEQDKFTGRTLHTVQTKEEPKQVPANPKQDSGYAELPPSYHEMEEQEQDLILAYLSKVKGYSTE